MGGGGERLQRGVDRVFALELGHGGLESWLLEEADLI